MNKKDSLRLEKFYNNYIHANNRNYDIIFLKYETMWDNLDKLFDFLGLNRNEISKFPTKRTKKYNSIQKFITFKLHKIYNRMEKHMDNMPPIKIMYKKG